MKEPENSRNRRSKLGEQSTPATFYDHLAKRADPSLLSDRAVRDAELKPEIKRGFEQNLSVYGVRKVWHQMRREGFDIA